MMESLFAGILSLWIAFAACSDSPVILNAGQQYQSQLQGSVKMDCHVRDAGDTPVEWYYEVHDQKISSGGTIVTIESGKDQRYSILSTQDGGDPSWNLVIANITKYDQGKYSCRVGKQKIVHTLVVTDTPTLPPAVINKTLDFSECCNNHNISDSCLPACSPYTIPVTFNPLEGCGFSDLDTILKCGSDGRNHIGCCARRNIPEICWDFCMGEIPQVLDSSHEQCLSHVGSLTECAEEGQLLLPSPPRNLYVLPASGDLLLTWEPPAENADLVLSYSAVYATTIEWSDEKSITKISKDQTNTRLTNLELNKQYYVYVTAVGQYGSSLPSEVDGVFLEKTASSYQTRNETILDCCNRRDISSSCKTQLCHANAFQGVDPDVVLTECFPHMNSIVQCFSGERDVTPCCTASGLEDICGPFCGSGELIELTWQVSSCLLNLPKIESCIMEGANFVPSAPQKFQLINYGSNFADFSWEKGDEKNVTMYVLQYWVLGHKDSSTVIIDVNGNPQARISGLQANTHYVASVYSVLGRYSSTPGSSIIFLTDVDVVSPSTLPPGSTSVPDVFYDETECCKRNGMPSSCLSLCDYDIITQNINIGDFLSCASHINTFLKCGSDGRNHIPCCLRNGITNNCLPVCNISSTHPIPSGIDTCIFSAQTIAKCYQEGVRILPKQPLSFEITNITSHVISLSWNPPVSGPKVDSYIVNYQADTAESFSQVTTTKTDYKLHSLMPSTRYTIAVQSKNSNGTSAWSPSFVVSTLAFVGYDHCFYTKKDNLIPSYLDNIDQLKKLNASSAMDCEAQCNSSIANSFQCIGYVFSSGICQLYSDFNRIGTVTKQGLTFFERNCTLNVNNQTFSPSNWANLTECCKGSNLTDSCKEFCISNEGLPDVCNDDYDKILTCSSDGKNHTDCCISSNVPSKCLGFCQGKTLEQKDILGALCLSYFRDILVCMGREFSFVPSPPLSFRMVSFSSVSVYLAWDRPQSNCDPDSCIFEISYWQKDKGLQEISVPGNVTSYTVKNLTASSTYYIYIIAKNNKGESLPSPKLIVITKSIDDLSVHFYQIPTGVIDQGSNVELLCEALGSYSDVDVSIKRNTNSLPQKLIVEEAKESDDGLYTCSASVPSMTVSAPLYLHIRYVPVIQTLQPQDVQALNSVAELLCSFYGMPLSTKWIYPSSVPAQQYNRFVQQSYLVDNEMIYVTKLIIYNVKDSDFGTYKCRGSNQFGHTDGHVSLRDANALPPPATYPPVDLEKNATKCCMNQNITGNCLEVCKYDIVVADLFNQPKYFGCENHFEGYLLCAADGKNHEKCCKSQGVSPFCQEFCRGNIPDVDDLNKLAECLGKAETIIQCMEDGVDKIPSPPQNVNAAWIRNSIQLTWEAPKELNGHEIFDVYWKTPMTKERRDSVEAQKLFFNINDLQFVGLYNMKVVARNNYGESNKVEKSIYVAGMRPRKPMNVKANLNTKDGTLVLVIWKAPEDDNVERYTVRYKEATSQSYKEINVTAATNEQAISGLKSNTKYSFWVYGTNKYGGGDLSDPWVTSTSVLYVADKNRLAPVGKGGVVAAAVVVSIILIALVAAVIIYKRKQQSKSKARSVAFENPRYGNNANESSVQISGLPGERQESGGSFDYEPLQEDLVPDTEYHNAATLDVHQIGHHVKS